MHQTFVIRKPDGSPVDPFYSVLEFIGGRHVLCDALTQQVEYIVRRKIFDPFKLSATFRHNIMEPFID